jgi:hypothetical protein
VRGTPRRGTRPPVRPRRRRAGPGRSRRPTPRCRGAPRGLTARTDQFRGSVRSLLCRPSFREYLLRTNPDVIVVGGRLYQFRLR